MMRVGFNVAGILCIDITCVLGESGMATILDVLMNVLLLGGQGVGSRRHHQVE